MMQEYVFDKQKIMDAYNGKVKDWFGNPSNEADAIQETFTFLNGEDLKRAHELYNLSIKHVNGNTYVKAEGTYKEYEEARNEFFSELGFEISGKMLQEAEREVER